jgi:flagellum-specific peptidoglycan hydrolase FlgJ
LNSIAAQFGVSSQTLIWANDLVNPDLLVTGTRLVVPAVDGVVRRVEPGDTLANLSSYFGADLQRAIELNGLEPPYMIRIGQQLLLPGGRIPEPPALAETAPVQEAEASGTGLASRIQPVRPVELPRPASGTPQQVSFILSIAEAARESQRETGVPASVTIAQAILESSWGTSRLSRENNNYFGIKAKERPGSAGVVWFNTWEVLNGQNVIQNQPFRAYKTIADSFVDHGLFFHQNGRYRAALAARADSKQFAREINRAGYATDPIYAPKLIGLMDRFNLYAYDLK